MQPSFSEIISYGGNGTAHSNCDCVVFRMDDVQDYWVKPGHLAAMNQFIDRNQSLTVGIIMNSIGNDSEIVNKVKQGKDGGLFELAVHGWNHTDYTKLSEEEQRNSLYDSNRKMVTLFGNPSEVFIPPYNAFNDDTINAMKQVNMKILNGNESSFDQLELRGNNNNESGISYIPSTIAFKDYYGGQYLQNSNQNIFNNVTQSISAYGYAVIFFHPQDFMKIDANGNPTGELDENPIRDLSSLIDLILSNNIHLGSFSEITQEMENNNKIMPSSNSTSQRIIAHQVAAPLFTSLTPNIDSAASSNCSGGWEVTGYFLPSESDYEGIGYDQTVEVYSLDATNNTTTRTLNSEFLKNVQVEGWGQTKQGDYIGGWDGKFWGPSSVGLNSQGETLIAGLSAGTNGNIIPYGRNFTIPTLPSPWNNKTFTAVDLGIGIVGKQINIYTGTGSSAEKEAAMLEQTEINTVCIPPLISVGDPVFDQFDSYIINSSNHYGITDKLMVKSLIMQESYFDNFLISSDIPCGVPNGWTDQESRSFGLTQVTPACGEAHASRPNLTTDKNSPNWATSYFNPEFNIDQGVKELSSSLSLMKSKFSGCSDEQYMLMALGAYNSGEVAIEGCDSWNDRADNYITNVTRNYETLSQMVNNIAKIYT
ncbi:MAG: polysaccharide deacetylase family protein [Nitrososphaeraceae archaeon]|nr:polysaccharide deacetylase family protein [Nitrososphaeraceae archaeon]